MCSLLFLFYALICTRIASSFSMIFSNGPITILGNHLLQCLKATCIDENCFQKVQMESYLPTLLICLLQRSTFSAPFAVLELILKNNNFRKSPCSATFKLSKTQRHIGRELLTMYTIFGEGVEDVGERTVL